MPDILEQTATLCQIEASAIRRGEDAVAAVATYIEGRRVVIEATARDSATLIEHAECCDEDDLECKQQLSHDLYALISGRFDVLLCSPTLSPAVPSDCINSATTTSSKPLCRPSVLRARAGPSRRLTARRDKPATPQSLRRKYGGAGARHSATSMTPTTMILRCC